MALISPSRKGPVYSKTSFCTDPYFSIESSLYAPSILDQRLMNAYKSLLSILNEPLPSAYDTSSITTFYYALRTAYYRYLDLAAERQREVWAREGMCLDPPFEAAITNLYDLRGFRDEVQVQVDALAYFDDLRKESRNERMAPHIPSYLESGLMDETHPRPRREDEEAKRVDAVIRERPKSMRNAGSPRVILRN